MPKLVKKGPELPKIGSFGFFEKCCHVWCFRKQSKMKTNIVIDISQTYWQNFGSRVMNQNAASQIKVQDSSKCNIVRKK